MLQIRRYENIGRVKNDLHIQSKGLILKYNKKF